MSNPFKNPGEDEKLKEENDFLKMKLMLENGAEFGEIEGADAFSPQVENQFLNYIMEFEKQAADHKFIKVYERIGKPSHFKPVAKIADGDIKSAWDELSSWMNSYGIDLGVCSPNINARELYRFTTEELFEHEMSDMNIPGMTTNFIYDEFYPDPIYESEKVVNDGLFPALFSAEPINEYFYCLQNKNIKLNGRIYNTSDEVKDVFSRFKSFFREIKMKNISIDRCHTKRENQVIVTGKYKAVAIAAGNDDEVIFEGSFKIELFPDDLGYWSIRNMKIEGINFE